MKKSWIALCSFMCLLVVSWMIPPACVCAQEKAVAGSPAALSPRTGNTAIREQGENKTDSVKEKTSTGTSFSQKASKGMKQGVDDAYGAAGQMTGMPTPGNNGDGEK